MKFGDETHPEHEMYREWIPVDYDPARFDLDKINEGSLNSAPALCNA